MPRTFCLVDDRLVEDTYFLRREVHSPVLRQTEPVIDPGQAYGTVLRDPDGGWRMYYLDGGPNPLGEHKLDRYEYRECFATSDDGVHWTRPDLGLVDVAGSRHNNAFLGAHAHDPAGLDLTGGSGPEGFCVLDAGRQQLPHVRSRYTALYLASPMDRWGGICLAHSDDGVHWTGYPENPMIPGWHDTAACFFHDPRIGRYVVYTRPPLYAGPHAANRKIARAESEDLVNWSTAQVVLDTDEGDADAFAAFDEAGARGEARAFNPRGRNRQWYGISVFPVHDLYLGLAWLYDVPSGTMWVELVRSNDGIVWRREPLRRPYLADGVPQGLRASMIVTMASPPIAVGDDLWLYASAIRRTHHEKNPDVKPAIHLLSLPRDRWVGYHAGERAGALLSRPFPWRGGPLTVNAAIAPGGELRVACLDELGNPIHAWGLDRINPLTGPQDGIALPVTFFDPPKKSFRLPPTGPVRVQFTLRHATLYAWTT